MTRKVAVIGVGDSIPARRRPDATYLQLAYDAASAAMKDAGVTAKEIQCGFFGTAIEAFCRQYLIFDKVVQTLGWTQKPMITFVNAGGSSAGGINSAYWSIVSGQYDLVMVLGGDKTSDADVPGHPGFQNIVVFGLDNTFEMPLGSGHAFFAMMGQHYMHTYGVTEEQIAKVSVKNHGNALLNPHAQSPKKITVEDVLKSTPVCYPIKFLDCSVISDLYGALIFASEEKVKELKIDTPIWIEGIGYANDASYLGYREVLNPGFDLSHPPALASAGRQAYEMAGIKDPQKELDIVELQDGFTFLELISYECLNFCKWGEGGKLIDEGVTELNGELPVNPSGGCLGHAHGYGGAGIVTMAEVVKQMRGECGDYQIKPIPRVGLCESMGGSSMTVAGVQILRR
ncbi:MAG: thiolase family protein [Thermodesulfobacteriota bacterium]|nr:thiolase family protein [Thermodesulfobacteriota bacterium]